MAEKEEEKKVPKVTKTNYPIKAAQEKEWKEKQYNGDQDAKNESSSTSSFFSSSNFTRSCTSGVGEHDEQEPSTSGCSSYLAHSQNISDKTKKKERVKEYLKELKSMVQLQKDPGTRMGTLSTLQHVLTSMRKIKDAKQKSKTESKARPSLLKDEEYNVFHGELMHTVYESDSHESLTSESLKSNVELRIFLTPNDRIVRAVSNNLKYVLGYPEECWVGRSFDDYVHKKDLITFNSFHKSCTESDEELDEEKLVAEKIFYFRLRKFKSLGQSGFSLRKQDWYMPFQCMFTRKKLTATELKQQGNFCNWYDDKSTSGISGSSQTSPEEKPLSPDVPKLYTILYCVPLVSPYTDDWALPEIKTFETRHTLFCSYCYIQPNTVPLLGYLPQEMIGVSIFDFYHNDDLKALYNIYQKVVSLKGVPYKSGPIRFLAKNGSWIQCVTEWSSFVNPWTKRLEFIIGKHEVVKGPEKRDVFSENFHMPTLEDTPDPVLQARQKIKDLLLQPVETVYVGSCPDVGPAKTKNKQRKTVAIADNSEYLPSENEIEGPTTKDNEMYTDQGTKSRLHSGGVLFKEGSIGQAYEQLNYTNCIKKFLLSQPLTFSSDSDAKKSSSEDGAEGEEEKANIPSDSNFDFDISVPKPPSFGSSTKVLVSEQEHRDNETISDPTCLREQLQLPSLIDSSGTGNQQRDNPLSSTENPQIMTLTRESLFKHTLLQEQIYIATASPDRNILFTMNQNKEDPCSKHQKRQSLKRSHSPDNSTSFRAKSGRHSDSLPMVATSASILNPTFPLSTYEKQVRDEKGSSHSTSEQMMFPIKMYPIVSLGQSPPSSDITSVDQFSGSGNKMQHWSYYQKSGMPIAPQVMMGFQASGAQSKLPQNLGEPVPVHQLNSYLMQQANMMLPKTTRMSRIKQEREKNKNLPQSSSDESLEETGSSLYLLESSKNKIKRDYKQMIMQSLAQQMCHKGLKSAPWLENVRFTDNVQYRNHMVRNKHKRVLKKDWEVNSVVVQPDMVLLQLDQLVEDLDTGQQEALVDIEQEYLFLPGEGVVSVCNTCVKNLCCKSWPADDHGIPSAMQLIRKIGKKEKRGKKPLTHGQQPMKAESTEKLDTLECKMEVENVSSNGSVSIEMKSKTESVSSKSESVEGNESSDSVNSLNTYSEMTPSDQRSNNENGSSMKESDGDAMSKKSDSSSVDKQPSSESESEMERAEYVDALFEKLFTSLNICFPSSHKNSAPWLLDVDFTDDVQYQYHYDTSDKKATLESDRQRMADLQESALVHEQLNNLMEDLKGNNGNTPISLSSPEISNAATSQDVEPASESHDQDGSVQFDILTKNGDIREDDDDDALNSLFTSL